MLAILTHLKYMSPHPLAPVGSILALRGSFVLFPSCSPLFFLSIQRDPKSIKNPRNGMSGRLMVDNLRPFWSHGRLEQTKREADICSLAHFWIPSATLGSPCCEPWLPNAYPTVFFGNILVDLSWRWRLNLECHRELFSMSQYAICPHKHSQNVAFRKHTLA